MAQKHDHNWVMGYEFQATDPFGNMRIDFNFQPPKVFKENLKMNFSECGGSFSDSSGNLLFYTNGIRIYNKARQLMENGDTINPGPLWNNQQENGSVSFYSPIAVYQPGAGRLCYLFHSDIFFGGVLNSAYTKHLYYSIIDLDANNGLGKVVAKNQILMEGEIMWPAAVKHGNGRDWWVMGLQRADTRHYLFLLSPKGITGPYIQDIGPPFVPTEHEGKNLFSPDGNTYLRHDSRSALRLYDFDRCTGQLSNLRIIPYKGQENTFFASFSPDSRFLYLNRPGYVWSLDLLAQDISTSFDTLADWELNYYPNYPWQTAYGFTQLGPDGKIYYSHWSGSSQALNVIHRPNLPGDAADCEEEAFYLPRWSTVTLTQFPNYRLGKWQASPCDTLQAQGPPAGGFTHTPYQPDKLRTNDQGYAVLAPIATGSCPDCTERELEILNNPQELLYGLAQLRNTGKLPDNWPEPLLKHRDVLPFLPRKKKSEK